MTDKKELNKEELEQVSGGFSYDGQLGDLLYIDKYVLFDYIGQNLYFFNDTQGSKFGYIYGTLNNLTDKESDSIFDSVSTQRIANVTIIKSVGNEMKSGIVDLSLKTWKAYKER